jgi:hypothetical protein
MKRVRVGPSRIAGQGLFAAMDLKQGLRIIQYIGEKISIQESDRRLAEDNVYIFELNEHYALDGKTPKNLARYINHSCAPNCEVENTGRTIWIVAARDIEEGEELSYNYGYPLDGYENHPCNCGAKQCCGYIVARQYWGQIKRQEPRQA